MSAASAEGQAAFCRPVRLRSALNQFGRDQFTEAMSDTPEAPTPLAPEEEVELNRLCEEYAVATAVVRKNLRFGNPPEPGRVLIFVESEKSAAAILARIKQILGVAH